MLTTRCCENNMVGNQTQKERKMDIETKTDAIRGGLLEICQRLRDVQREHDELLIKLSAMESQAKQLITKACCSAVEKMTELAPNQGWDSGEVVAETYIRQLSDKPVLSDKTKYKTVNVSDLSMESTREHLLKEVPSYNQQSVVKIISKLVEHIERETCLHEETHRCGAIWEVCNLCGDEWADDRGGKPEFKWPSYVDDAHTLLNKLNTSRQLSADNPSRVVPKNFQDAIVVLKENLRDKDRGVKACGMRDNDQVRDALNTLLSDTPHNQWDTEVAQLKTVINTASECFSCAFHEGWIDALSDGNIEKIRDLWQRRISCAMNELENILPPIPDPWDDPSHNQQSI